MSYSDIIKKKIQIDYIYIYTYIKEILKIKEKCFHLVSELVSCPKFLQRQHNVENIHLDDKKKSVFIWK